jgi:hypothetical protein
MPHLCVEDPLVQTNEAVVTVARNMTHEITRPTRILEL